MRVVVPENITGGVRVPPAVYQWQITDGKLGKSKQQNTMITWTFTCMTQGPTEEKTIGKKIEDRSVFTEDALWRIDLLHKACTGQKLPPGEYDENELAQYLLATLRGKTFMASVKDDTWNGQTRSIIENYVLPVPEGAIS